MKQIYEKRLNTINRYVKRGTLDADLAEAVSYTHLDAPNSEKSAISEIRSEFRL